MAKTLGFEPKPEQQGFAGFGSFDRCIDMLAGLLTGRDYDCGARFTMADVYVGSQVIWGMMFKAISDLPGFTGYAERLEARPAYRAANETQAAEPAA